VSRCPPGSGGESTLLRGLEGTCQSHNSSALSTAAQTKAEKTYLVFTWSLFRCRIAERYHSGSVYSVFFQFELSQTSVFAKGDVFIHRLLSTDG